MQQYRPMVRKKGRLSTANPGLRKIFFPNVLRYIETTDALRDKISRVRKQSRAPTKQTTHRRQSQNQNQTCQHYLFYSNLAGFDLLSASIWCLFSAVFACKQLLLLLYLFTARSRQLQDLVIFGFIFLYFASSFWPMHSK